MRESHTLDGKTIFEWRAEYVEMAERFVEYADHHQHCTAARVHHWHPRQEDWDRRTICSASPCICGVLIILILLAPEKRWIQPCPEQPTPLMAVHTTRRTRPVLREDGTPLTIFNIPVVEVVEDDEDTVPKTD
jgi:hypothetical protein